MLYNTNIQVVYFEFHDIPTNYLLNYSDKNNI